jgi:ribonuclease D
VSPDAARRVLWSPPEDTGIAAVATALSERGARPWQIELTAPVLAKAFEAGLAAQVTRQ